MLFFNTCCQRQIECSHGENLSHGSASSFVTHQCRRCMTSSEDPDALFPTVYSLKDLHYALVLAAQVGVDAAGARVVEGRFLEPIEQGYGDNREGRQGPRPPRARP